MDYNPVAVLIEKCTLEYPLIYGVSKENDQWSENNQLSKDVEKWSRWVYNAVKSEIGEYYPKENGSVPVGYIWARTIPCQNPTCDSEIPLMRQFWLSKKTGQNIVLKPSVKNSEIHFEIADYDKLSDFNPNKGTVSRAIVECPVCKSKIDGDTTRKLFQDGKSGEKLVAVILNEKNKKGKIYRIATIKDKEIFENSKKQLNIKIKSFLEKWGMDPIPNEEIPIVHTITQRPFAPRENYGFMEWGDLFNPRQQLSLITFMDKIKEAHNEMLYEGVLKDYAKVLVTYLAFGLDRLLDFGSSLCVLNPTGGRGVVHTFGRQALQMTWDYAESNPFNPFGAGWYTACEKNVKWINHASLINNSAVKVSRSSATNLNFPDNFFDAVFTDPPYYDNVPYAYLSDFFYVWLKRVLGDLYPDLFLTPLTPKNDEIVAYSNVNKRFKDGKEFFEEMLKKSFQEIYRVLKPNGITTIVYAYKTTEGWETVINAILDSGLTVTASWPLSTEMKGRLRAQNSASLASSIYIVARKINKKEFGWLKEIKEELINYVPIKLDKLWEEGIYGADFFVAAIGSAIEIFGKYKRVLDNEGNEIRADKLLSFVRDVVTNYTVRQILHNGIADELSPLTKFYLLWRWNYQEARVPFDEARKLAQSAGIDLSNEWNKKDGFILKNREFITVQGPDKRDKKLLEDSLELIDVLHQVCLLWKDGKKDEMNFVLKKSGIGDGESLYKVAQAISETLPNKSAEKKMLEGFLAGKDKIMDNMREDESQTKLL